MFWKKACRAMCKKQGSSKYLRFPGLSLISCQRKQKPPWGLLSGETCYSFDGMTCLLSCGSQHIWSTALYLLLLESQGRVVMTVQGPHAARPQVTPS